MDIHIGRNRRIIDVYLDSTREERIALVKNLYMRPGTPGEKAAAAEALRRMGISENDPIFRSPRQETPPPPSQKPRHSGPRRYEVTLQYDVVNNKGRHINMKWGPIIIEATDEIAAEGLARKEFKEMWRRTFGGRVPEARYYSTRRV